MGCHVRFLRIRRASARAECQSTPLLPSSGPDPHPGGSNWQRPGDEWGTTFDFPQPGCWQLQVTRGAGLTASVWIIVGA